MKVRNHSPFLFLIIYVQSFPLFFLIYQNQKKFSYYLFVDREKRKEWLLSLNFSDIHKSKLEISLCPTQVQIWYDFSITIMYHRVHFQEFNTSPEEEVLWTIRQE